MTLRVFKRPGTTPPPLATFNPAKNPPIIVVAEKNCVPGTPGCAGAESLAPELFITTNGSATSDLGSVTPSSVAAGQFVTVPGAPAVKNGGTLAASDRSHGYFLVPSTCTLPTWNAPGGDVLPACAVALSEQTYVSPGNGDLATGASENLLTSVRFPWRSGAVIGATLCGYADRFPERAKSCWAASGRSGYSAAQAEI